ncbi:MAG: ATP-dependent zinc protease [Oligoflexales bacterium]
MARNLQVVGWREWVSFPQIGIKKIKAKIDTGARTSALHAFDIQEFKQGTQRFVQFKVHPLQRNSQKTVTVRAKVAEIRRIKDSGGNVTERPVIVTDLQIGESVFPIELTLINRDEMGFRLLLGRSAVKNMFLVDSGRSYLKSKRGSKEVS